jgi:hypothetical protein
LKIVEHPKHDFVIQDYKGADKPASMIVGWCRTTKFDWFAVRHNSDGDSLGDGSEILHVEFGDLADPSFEPLDIAVLQIISPTLTNLGSMTPKIIPRVGFALFRHDFEDSSKSEMLLMHQTLPRSEMQMTLGNNDRRRANIDKIRAGGFSLTLASDVFSPADLKKICSSFKSRMRRAMKKG